MSTEKNNEREIFVYTPRSIIVVFNAALNMLEERSILRFKGVYQAEKSGNYKGFYYDKLKEEAGDYTVKLLVPELIRRELISNTTIEFNGTTQRKIVDGGKVELHIEIIELIEKRINKFTEEDAKKIEILNKKAEQGIKDVDSIIKKKIFNDEKVKVHVILGKTAIIDNDIIKQMAEGIALYEITYHRVLFTSEDEISSKIIEVAAQQPDIICVSRGGGENIDVFEKPKISEAALHLNCAVVSAIGHEVNKTLFEKVSDKKFITPTAFGQYLKEFYSNTLEEFEKSKAKLILDIKKNLETNYLKQISNLNQQLISLKELNDKTLLDKENIYSKTLSEVKKLHIIEVENMNKQMEALQLHFQTQSHEREKMVIERENILSKRISTLNQEKEEKDRLISQANILSNQMKANTETLQKRLENIESNKITHILFAAAVAAILGLIIGLLI